MRGTIQHALAPLATAAEQHARMLALSDLLNRLWHHHLSQSKSHTTACSKSYNKQLADELSYHLGYRDHPAPKAGTVVGYGAAARRKS